MNVLHRSLPITITNTRKLTTNHSGRRILNLQTTLSLLHSPLATSTQSLTAMPSSPTDTDTRTPFTHPSLTSLQNLTDTPPDAVLTKKRLSNLATQLGAREILRWKPRLPHNLDGSGVDVVLTSTVYAIIGAVALQRGAEVANRVARERVLKPLGVA